MNLKFFALGSVLRKFVAPKHLGSRVHYLGLMEPQDGEVCQSSNNLLSIIQECVSSNACACACVHVHMCVFPPRSEPIVFIIAFKS